jgi:hypothetical protein
MLKHIPWITLVALIATGLFIRKTWADTKPHTFEPIAVVELFTSEGCSSCPPADELLARITQHTRKQGLRVYPLSFHVDYWNYLGWKDPFSDTAYTRRQRQYGQVMALSSIYTPQIIVNGTDQFVGHRQDTADKSIEKALNTRVPVRVELQVTGWADGALVIAYKTINARSDMNLHIALVERGLKKNIARGENRGKTLHHENVVRVFKTVDPGEGQITIQPPEEVDRGQTSVIAYVQEVDTMRIVGASMVDFE